MLFYSIAFPLELTRKHISDMFFRGEIEEELRECPSQLEMVRFKSDSDMQMFMMSVEDGRMTNLYPHQRSNQCIQKGQCVLCMPLGYGNYISQ